MGALALGMRIMSHMRSLPKTDFTSAFAAISLTNRTTFGIASRAAGSSDFANAGNKYAAARMSAIDGASPAKYLFSPNRAFALAAAAASAFRASSNASSSIAIPPDSITVVVIAGPLNSSFTNVVHASISFASHALGCVTPAFVSVALFATHSKIASAPSTVSSSPLTSTGGFLHAPVYFLNNCVVSETPPSLASARAASLPSRSLV